MVRYIRIRRVKTDSFVLKTLDPSVVLTNMLHAGYFTLMYSL